MSKAIFTVYRTTNRLNDRIYIGVHKTLNPNDQYLGSGKLIKAALAKHGRENFTKEVLFTFENPEEAYAKEAELVNEAFVAQNETYNVMVGGTYSHSDKYGKSGRENSQHGTVWVWHPELGSKKVREGQVEPGWQRGRPPTLRGKKVSALSEGQKFEVRKLHSEGLSPSELASLFQVSKGIILRALGPVGEQVWKGSLLSEETKARMARAQVERRAREREENSGRIAPRAPWGTRTEK